MCPIGARASLDPIISYLIPSYNHAPYLPLLLEQIVLDIRQLDVPAEVIIVDDGSKDNSANIIRQWASNHSISGSDSLEPHINFEIITHFQANQGLTAVLNWMVAKARGQHLRLCASDDLLTIGSTQQLYAAMKVHPKSICILADAEVIDEKGNLIHPSSIAYHGGKKARLLNPRHMRSALISRFCVAGPSHLIKKSHYADWRYQENEKIDDFDLFLSLLQTPEGIFYLDKKVCSYRIHGLNTSKTDNIHKRIENIYSFLATINRYLDKKLFVKELLPLKYKSSAKIYFLQKKWIRAAFHMGVSLLLQFKKGLYFDSFSKELP